jgi:riboflavin synthase
MKQQAIKKLTYDIKIQIKSCEILIDYFVKRLEKETERKLADFFAKQIEMEAHTLNVLKGLLRGEG